MAVSPVGRLIIERLLASNTLYPILFRILRSQEHHFLLQCCRLALSIRMSAGTVHTLVIALGVCPQS